MIAEAEAARAKAMSEKGGAAAAVSALTAKANLDPRRIKPSGSSRLRGEPMTHATIKLLLGKQKMKIDVPLKRPEFKRDEMGRFERRGGDLIKKRGVIKRNTEGQFEKGTHGGPRAGAGRPRGAKNKTTLQLREAVLAALDKVGGVDYLAKLAIENSSAFASLLGKVLPTTLTADSDGGEGAKIEFRRIIVHPGGREEIEGQTPKLLPPASHVLPSPTYPTDDTNDIK